MSAAQTRSGSSPWRSTLNWTTPACLTALAAGLITLAAGHPLQGWLLVLGAVMLVKGTVWGRRDRRHPEMPMLTQPPAPTTTHAQRKWRKAA